MCLINLLEFLLVYLCIEMNIYSKFGKPRKLFFEYVMGQTLPGDAVLYLASQFIHALVKVNGMALKRKLPCCAEPCRTSADNSYSMSRGLLFFRGRQFQGKASQLVYIQRLVDQPPCTTLACRG